MHRIVALMMICILPFIALAQQTESVPEKMEYDEGYRQGHRDGMKVSQGQWGSYGFVGGCLGCCLGAGVVWYLANERGDSPEYVPEGTSEFKKGYTVGYWEATNSKKRKSAFIGSAVAMVLLAGVVIVGIAIDPPPIIK